MTDEMLDLARANAAEAGVENVEFVKGYIEELPLVDASVDVVISNCVINLSADKPRVLREVARVLRPGGRFAVSDVIADPDMDEATRADMQASDRLRRRSPHARRVRGIPSRRRPHGDRDHRDPPRAGARSFGDHPRAQAGAVSAARARRAGRGGASTDGAAAARQS
jgi:SAM-dependent methyltransferase